MKILTSVINKLIDKQMTTEELTSAFLLLGYEVESVIKANQIEGVKFGKTISCSKHPNADKLSLCEVETEGQTYQVICGGKNVASDQVIVHALPGSKVNGFELQMKELRGIESAGMILSITEVGGFSKDLLSIEEQNNIIVMDSSVDLTNDVVSTLGFEGDVIEIDILPDRKYAESYMMIARELSALHGETLKANSTVDTKYMNSILVFNGIELKDEQSNSSEFKTIIGIDKEQTPKTTVSYNDDFAVKYIGNDIDLNDAKIKLGLLGFDFSDDSVSFPEWRTDIESKEHIVEELLRFIGIMNITPVEVVSESIEQDNKHLTVKNEINVEIIKYGFREISTYKLVEQEEFDKWNIWEINKPTKLDSKYSLKFNHLQPSLIPGLIDTFKTNYRKEYEDQLLFFETSNVFINDEPNFMFSFIHDEKMENPSLFSKSIILKTLESIGVKRESIEFKQTTRNIFNPFLSSEIYVNGELIGVTGEIHPKILRQYKFIRLDKVKTKIYVTELNVEKLLKTT